MAKITNKTIYIKVFLYFNIITIIINEIFPLHSFATPLLLVNIITITINVLFLTMIHGCHDITPITKIITITIMSSSSP